jgi:pimeloyl-ACP methyl ester carboxylesterase
MEDVNHGSLMTADLMNDYPALLAAGRRVITVERQGHGHTRDIGRPLWYELLAGDIAALLDHLGLPRAGTSHAGLCDRAEWVVPMIAEFLGDAGG